MSKETPTLWQEYPPELKDAWCSGKCVVVGVSRAETQPETHLAITPRFKSHLAVAPRYKLLMIVERFQGMSESRLQSGTSALVEAIRRGISVPSDVSRDTFLGDLVVLYALSLFLGDHVVTEAGLESLRLLVDTDKRLPWEQRGELFDPEHAREMGGRPERIQ